MNQVTERQHYLAQQVNIITESDSYKWSHDQQSPPWMKFISAYLEARGVAKDRNWTHMVNFGQQAYLKHLVENPVTKENIEEAEDIHGPHGIPFNRQVWLDVVNDYGGYIPVEITALDEGMVVPLRTPLLQSINTDPRFRGMSCFMETGMQRAIWYASTVATQSFHMRRILIEWLLKTGTAPDAVRATSAFMMQDFGGRGVSSHGSAEIGGGAHLTSFKGTDTIEALRWLRRYYDAPMAGHSVVASEHSTMTAWGPGEGEVRAYENMLDRYAKPGAIISVVSDGYDIFNACANIWGGVLKDKVNALAKIGARLVIRPDSGDPATVLVNVLSILTEKFGYTLTPTGHKLLPAHIRVLQGDGISESSLVGILGFLAASGYAIENMVFGSGGALLQKLDRDTLKFAMKASAGYNDDTGEWVDIFKDPVTDHGKISKRGRQSVFMRDGVLISERLSMDNMHKSLLLPRYRNGDLFNTTNLDAIRERIEAAL